MPPKTPSTEQLRTIHIPPLRTPEIGMVNAADIEEDLRVYIDATYDTPPSPEGEIDYDPEYEAAYYGTREFLVDRLAYYAVQSPHNFVDLVSDMAKDNEWAKIHEAQPTLDPSIGPEKIEKTFQMVDVIADALVPVTPEAVVTGENYRNIDTYTREIGAIISKVVNHTIEHKGKGSRALLEAIDTLKQFGRYDLGSAVREQLEIAIDRVATQMGKSSERQTQLKDDARQAHTSARQAAAQAGHLPPSEESGKLQQAWEATKTGATTTGRGITKAASGHNRRQELAELFTERDEDKEARQRKYQERQIANSHAVGATASRGAGLATFEAAQQKIAQGRLELAAEALDNLTQVLFKQRSSGEVVMDVTPVDAHKGLSTDPAQRIEDLRTAPTSETVAAEGEADPLKADLAQASLFIDRERERLWKSTKKQHPNEDPLMVPAREYLDVVVMSGKLEGLKDMLDELEKQRAKSPHNMDDNSVESMLHWLTYNRQERQYMTRLLIRNQAVYQYGKDSISTAPMLREDERYFGGRRSMTLLEDGGILFGEDDDPGRTIYYSNGDYAVLAEVDPAAFEENPKHYPGIFHAQSNNASGEATPQGFFERIKPNGYVRPERTKQFLTTAEAKRHDKLRYEERESRVNPIVARDRFNAAREEFYFVDNERMENAEEFINEANLHLDVYADKAHDVQENTDLYRYLDVENIVNSKQREINTLKASPDYIEERDAVTIARKSAEINGLKDFATAYGNDSRNAYTIGKAKEEATELDRVRYEVMRAAAYDGRTKLLGDGSIILPAEQSISQSGYPDLHTLLGLPEGTWTIGPDGSAMQNVYNKKTKRTETRYYPTHTIVVD